MGTDVSAKLQLGINQAVAWLVQPISNVPLITFRIFFGAIMVFGTLRFWVLGWIEDHYIHSKVQFKYFGFEWVELLSPNWMYALHIGMIVGALGIMLGLFYRLSAVLHFLCFTYVQLIDATYYLNHYYFVSLISFLLIFLPMINNSEDDSKSPRDYVPRWTILALQVQVAIVYIYAGLAKLNYAWLIEALPLRLWLPAHDTMPIFGKLLAHEWTPWVFSWAGMFYDCSIVFFLIWKKTRWWAFAAVVFFHSMVGALFQIGIFPIVMIGAVLIFFDGGFHERLLSSFTIPKHREGKRKVTQIMPWLVLSPATSLDVVGDNTHYGMKHTHTFTIPKLRNSKRWAWLFIPFFAFQLLFPWRYLLHDGNIFWNEEGYRFSWRVMLMEKAGTATFFIEDGKTGKVGVVNNGDFLCAHQEKQMAMQPDMILQFAHFLGNYYAKKGVQNPKVSADVYVTLNGAPSQRYIDKAVNLMEIKDTWKQKAWVLPLKK